MSKFHPDDLKNPVYEYSQVVTIYDLRTIYHGLALQHHETKWWQFSRRHDLIVAGNAIYELMLWLQDGKAPLRDIGAQ